MADIRESELWLIPTLTLMSYFTFQTCLRPSKHVLKSSLLYLSVVSGLVKGEDKMGGVGFGSQGSGIATFHISSPNYLLNEINLYFKIVF